MSASTAPAAKAALIAMLEADPTVIAGAVQIEYADPGPAIKQEAMWFERTLLEEKAAAIGRQRRTETYILELVVFVVQDGGGGDRAKECEERAWALVAVVENLLRPPTGPAGDASANLAGAVNLWAEFAGCDMVPGTAPKGGQRAAIAECRIRCHSRK